MQRKRRLRHFICRFILKISGWKVIKKTPSINKSVICLAPHTSNWDFIIAKLIYGVIDNAKPKFLMKKEWFFFPLSLIFKHMGGIPVDRSKRTSITDYVSNLFKKYETFHIGITPEGTRKAVEEWKKGFYYIALKAKVPIQLGFIDYAKKEAGIMKIFYPTGDEQSDLKAIKDFYKGIRGKFPEKFII